MALSKLKLSNHLLKTVNDAFKEFVSRQGNLSMLVAGKTGVGKSRLVNALVGRVVAAEGHQKNFCTTSVNSYSTNIEGTTICVYDSPGLQDSRCEDQSDLDGLAREARKGRLDVMLYCIKMDDKYFHNEDKNAIRALTHTFGPEIWETSIIALTFANKIQDPDEGDEQEYFQRDYKFWRDEINAFLAELEVDSTIREAIPIVPAGNSRKPQLPTTENWLSELWLECYLRMSDSARMNLYRPNKSRLAFPGSANMEAACSDASPEGPPEDACFPVEGEERQTGLVAEPDTTQGADDDHNIPRDIPFNKDQQDQFWRKTWDAFLWYCIHTLRRPEVRNAVVRFGYEVLILILV